MIFELTYPVAIAVLLVVYWLLPARARDGFLAAGSLLYLLWVEPVGVGVMAVGALGVFLLSPHPGSPRGRRWICPALIIALLAHLAWLKYVPAILASIRQDAEAMVVVTVGLSYFTFKLVHYVVERSWGTVTDRSPARFFCWLFLLPTFAAGPIERFDHFLTNREDRPRAAAMGEGLTRIAYGLVKKVVLVEMLAAPLQNYGGAARVAETLPHLATGEVWAFCILRYLRIYLDFSAYTDLAVGTSRLFGIGIMENFRWPVVARDIGEFWSRWHMTLSGWCQTYVYLPVIGLTRRPHLAVYCSFLAIGLWHAGALHVVYWGLYHGTGVALLRLWRRRPPLVKRRAPEGWAALPGRVFTFLFVSASFALTMPLGSGSSWDGIRILLKLIFVNLDAEVPA